MRLFKYTALFTFFSLALGVGSALSPDIAALGWLLGTLLSAAGGAVYGARAAARGEAARGGAIVGGIPILIGCGLAAVVGPVLPAQLIVAVVVGVIAGIA